MAVQLEIRDGSPNWWASPDIWVVPGSDPTGAPGIPIAGQQAFVWARVENHGSTQATNTRVDFWWADPSTQVLRSNANFIGGSFVDLPPGAAEEVLCLVPWNVVLVNNGHECLIAVASHPGDSVPDPAPDDFNPPQYAEVAQRNLDVMAVSMQMMMITVAAGRREDKRVQLHLERGGKLDSDQLVRLGLRGFKPCTEAKVKAQLSTTRPNCSGEQKPVKDGPIELSIARGTRKSVYLHVTDSRLNPSEYELVHVVERKGDEVLGGCSVALIADNGGRHVQQERKAK